MNPPSYLPRTTDTPQRVPIAPSGSRQWHPKISPYRLIVFITTVSLATAKTLSVQAGSLNTPTTLDWVGGTALSILFFSISSYDDNSAERRTRPPAWLEWLFRPDCMSVVWSLLSLFSISQPAYVSNERVSHSRAYLHPPVTAYRILVCGVAVVFGMSKAVLSYRNASSSAGPWLEWSMTVPIFAILYCLGLYEYNSVGFLAPFFEVDRSDILLSLNMSGVYILVLLLCAGWIYVLGRTMSLFSYHPSLLSELQRTNAESFTTFSKLIGHEFLLAGVVAGALTFLFVLRNAVLRMSNRGGLVRRVARQIRRGIFGLIRWRWRYDQNGVGVHGVDMAEVVDIFDFVLHLVIHISTYLFGAVVCLTLAVPGSPLVIAASVAFDPLRLNWGSDTFVFMVILRGFNYLALFVSLWWSIGVLIHAVGMILMLLEPFYYLCFHERGTELGSRREILQGRLIGLGPYEKFL